MPNVQIMKKIEFDAGHRLMHHNGLCKNVHGHRYKVEVEVSGPIDPQTGLILDFSALSHLLNVWVKDLMDHACLVSREDKALLTFLQENSFKHCVLPSETTAESIAQWIFDALTLASCGGIPMGAFDHLVPRGVRCVRVSVWETPSSKATVLATGEETR